MNRRSRIAVVGLAGAVSGIALLGLANAQTSGERPPRGPFVDFCPTPEQAEAHLQEYGFDYKPTVVCTSEGEEVATSRRSDSAQPPPPPQQATAAQMAQEKAYMQSLQRGPEKDGDPATIEGIGPDGEEVTIFVQTSQPERYRGMTPAEFAEEVYP